MRNNSKKYKRRHLPQSEWSKILRFNGKDYLMKTVYDKSSELDIDDDEQWNAEHSLETNDIEKSMISVNDLPWMKQVPSGTKRINEDFFDDFGEDVLVNNQKSAKQKVIERSDYPMLTADGEAFDVEMSSDEIKNAIFHLIVNFITVYSPEGFKSVDNFLYETGRMNDINSYKMAFDELLYSNGTFSFVPKNALSKGKSTGWLQIYFTGERDANFRIDLPNISVHRPTQQVNMNYESLCDLINVETAGILRKKAADYYSQTLRMLFDSYMRESIGLTLVRRTGNFGNAVYGQIESPRADAMFVKNNFSVIQKYSVKNRGDYQILENAVDEDMSMIEEIYNGQKPDVRADELWVLISGRETYIKSLYESVWLDRYRHSNVFGGINFIPVRFFTPNPNTPVMKIEHNMILAPLSAFVTGTPGLLMHIL